MPETSTELAATACVLYRDPNREQTVPCRPLSVAEEPAREAPGRIRRGVRAQVGESEDPRAAPVCHQLPVGPQARKGEPFYAVFRSSEGGTNNTPRRPRRKEDG